MSTTPAVHPTAELARLAVEAWVTEGLVIPPRPLPEGLPHRAGVFVTLRTGEELRGCIGTIEPIASTLAEEIIRNAIAAAVDDPRFPPVDRGELRNLSYTVYILEQPEAVAGLGDLDPARFGVIVRAGRRRGLLLPGIQGVETPEAQVAIARRKANIPADSPVELFRFRTRDFS